MGNGGTRPLVTFYVIAYNQARFVREAVEGALAQTYCPLEIILSDDCSTDDTFAIMQDAVKTYTGPHKIILNRNSSNLGVSAHINRIVELTTGELMVAADGDDVSHAERTERIVDVWLNCARPAALACSVWCIDADGNASPTTPDEWMAQILPGEAETRTSSLLRYVTHGAPRMTSCSGAWTRTLWEQFGPIASGIWFEDDLITLRAWLFDRVVYIQEPLVSYRSHDSNIFNRVPKPLTTVQARHDAEEETRTEARRRVDCLKSFIPDMDIARRRHWITDAEYHQLGHCINARCASYRVIENWWSGGWSMRVRRLFALARAGRVRHVRWGSPRLLPLPIFLAMGALWSLFRVTVRFRWVVLLALDPIGAY